MLNRILLVNDDGIDAEGLALLESMAKNLAKEIIIFAPDENCSGRGRALTFGRDLTLRQHSENRFSCDGTPADCVILALHTVMQDRKPDLVLSGINLGMNVADDITCSGTVGAAWEAAVQRLPAISLSQRFDNDVPDTFAAARAHAPDLIKTLWQNGLPADSIVNINFPSKPVLGRKITPLGRHQSSEIIPAANADNRYQIGDLRCRGMADDGSDIAQLHRGYITISPITISPTDHSRLAALSALES